MRTATVKRMAGIFVFLGAPSVVAAQRANQVVRFTVIGATQASFSSGTGTTTDLAGSTQSGAGAPSAGPDGFRTATATSISARAAARPAPVFVPSSYTFPSANGRTSSQAVMSVPIWQASMAVTNSGANEKVTVSLDKVMPTGMALTLELAAPHGGETAGMVALDTGGTDALSSMPSGNATSIQLGFGIAAAEGAEEKDAGPRQVSFTLISGA